MNLLTNSIFLSLYFSAHLFNVGYSCLQGWHHEAHTSITTYFPLNCCKKTSCLEVSLNTNLGHTIPCFNSMVSRNSRAPKNKGKHDKKMNKNLFILFFSLSNKPHKIIQNLGNASTKFCIDNCITCDSIRIINSLVKFIKPIFCFSVHFPCP